MIGIRCEASRLIEVAEAVAAFPETDYVVVTAGSYDILVEAVAEDNEALLAFLSREAAQDPGRARDGDVRLPAPDEAELPVGHPLTLGGARAGSGGGGGRCRHRPGGGRPQPLNATPRPAPRMVSASRASVEGAR